MVRLTADNEVLDTDTIIDRVLAHANDSIDMMINGTAMTMLIDAIKDESVN